MYQNDRIALAIFEDAYYRFNLPQPISELLESETFILGFAYTDQFNQIHSFYTPGAKLTSIQLLFADDED